MTSINVSIVRSVHTSLTNEHRVLLNKQKIFLKNLDELPVFQAEDEKYKNYTDLMDQFIFVPIATETSGIFGKVGLQLIKKIGSKITAVTHERRATSYLIQRIAVAIQRGNVASILGTLPETKNLGEIFYI